MCHPPQRELVWDHCHCTGSAQVYVAHVTFMLLASIDTILHNFTIATEANGLQRHTLNNNEVSLSLSPFPVINYTVVWLWDMHEAVMT